MNRQLFYEASTDNRKIFSDYLVRYRLVLGSVLLGSLVPSQDTKLQKELRLGGVGGRTLFSTNKICICILLVNGWK